MFGRKAIEILDAIGEGACPHTSELTRVADIATVVRVLRESGNAGLIESFTHKEGVGRPKIRYRLTRRGWAFKEMLDQMRFLVDYRRVEQAGIPVTVGLVQSVAEYWGAPLVVGYGILVPRRFIGKARKLVGWKGLEIGETILKGIPGRSVEAGELRYLSLVDAVVLAAKDENPRLPACAATLINDFAAHLNFDLLLELALELGAVNEVGGLLYMTNRLAGREVAPSEVLREFRKRVVKRKVRWHPRYLVLEKRGVAPSGAEHPIDRKLREDWCAELPTFEECKEIFGWRDRGLVGGTLEA